MLTQFQVEQLTAPAQLRQRGFFDHSVAEALQVGRFSAGTAPPRLGDNGRLEGLETDRSEPQNKGEQTRHGWDLASVIRKNLAKTVQVTKARQQLKLLSGKSRHVMAASWQAGLKRPLSSVHIPFIWSLTFKNTFLHILTCSLGPRGLDSSPLSINVCQSIGIMPPVEDTAILILSAP